MSDFQGNKGYLDDNTIRIFLRDADPAANLLLDDYEFSQEEIRTAANLTVDQWNETPPPVRKYTVDSFPWRYHLLIGTCSKLMVMAANAFRRNRLAVQVPGGTADDQNKEREYLAAADRFNKEFKEWMRDKKVEKNMEEGWGEV